MVRTKDGDGIKSNLIVAEVQKRPCLFDTNDVFYSDRLRKERSWDEVCECVVPGWDLMRQFQKLEAGMLGGYLRTRGWSGESTRGVRTSAHGCRCRTRFNLRALCSVGCFRNVVGNNACV